MSYKALTLKKDVSNVEKPTLIIRMSDCAKPKTVHLVMHHDTDYWMLKVPESFLSNKTFRVMNFPFATHVNVTAEIECFSESEFAKGNMYRGGIDFKESCEYFYDLLGRIQILQIEPCGTCLNCRCRRAHTRSRLRHLPYG